MECSSVMGVTVELNGVEEGMDVLDLDCCDGLDG
jgi:hypothetical protein